MIRPIAETGIESLDNLLHGGLPIGAVSELVEPEYSGRTDIALSFVARLTQASTVCAWIDASNNFDPVSAAAAGVDLARLLWVRGGAVRETVKRPTRSFVLPDKYLVPRPAKQSLYGRGFGSHPRGEAKGLSGGGRYSRTGGGTRGKDLVVGIDLGNGDDQGVFDAGSIEEGAEACAIIGA